MQKNFKIKVNMLIIFLLTLILHPNISQGALIGLRIDGSGFDPATMRHRIYSGRTPEPPDLGTNILDGSSPIETVENNVVDILAVSILMPEVIVFTSGSHPTPYATCFGYNQGI